MPVPPAPPSWYPDPDDPRAWRWWDGTTWTTHVSGATSQDSGKGVPAANWYPDPDDPRGWRWWDGTAWTSYVSGPGVLTPQLDLRTRRASEEKIAGLASWTPVGWALCLIALGLTYWATASQYADFFHAMRVSLHHLDSGGQPITSFPTYPVWTDVFEIPLLATEVTFFVWQFRSAQVARSIGYPARHSPGWGVGCWFIPIVNIWMPYQAVRDLLPSSHPARKCLLVAWLALVTVTILAGGIPFVLAERRSFGLALFAVTVVLECSVAVFARRFIRAVEQDHRSAVAT